MSWNLTRSGDHSPRRHSLVLYSGAPQAQRSRAQRPEEAASRLQKMLKAEGISEEEIVADFKRWRCRQA